MASIRSEVTGRGPRGCLSAVSELIVPTGSRVPWSVWLHALERRLSYLISNATDKNESWNFASELQQIAGVIREEMLPREPESCLEVVVTAFTFRATYKVGHDVISFVVTLFLDYKGNLKNAAIGDVKDGTQANPNSPGLHTTANGRIRLCADTLGKNRRIQKNKHSDCKV